MGVNKRNVQPRAHLLRPFGQSRCAWTGQAQHGAQRLELLLLVRLGQDGDVLRAGLLGDGHEIDRLAQEDVLVAAQE